ncbi:MAG: hypothetical protein RMJ18_01440 [Candidatus Aenigmarchaeota archaeon]|nr:hypothetical protein [Candidatus Aenigmarchaeota archaeon]MDW8160065.1 hypothetical protein [Candidatus Aenigmarchaeota archaeon]
MKHSVKVGVSFGLTSAVITTLGLMVGLDATTGSKLAVIGGILIIAVADALSDALGIHISEESENKHSKKEVWASTIFTFLSKFFCGISFIFPIILFPLEIAVKINIMYGLFLLSIFSYYITDRKNKKINVVLEHLCIAIFVLIFSYYFGIFIKNVFK